MPESTSQNMTARKAELLESAVDYIYRHGLADLSLRPLAAAIGTSARLLVYHFGSKEQLITDALDGVRARQEALVGEWLDTTDDQSFEHVMERFWSASSSPEAQAYGRLFFEAYGMSLIDDARLPGFLDGSVRRWVDLIAEALVTEGVPTDQAETLATSALAVHRGLLLDLLATGDRERVDTAHHHLTQSLAAAAATATAPRGPR
ncbi:TetR/AcrR family transcriptional regulator [Tsukamurella strandjordii]|uniref:TetR/AcrR family transcriptional regulator n=1 Tax=Tsukamurella TaxID=2060 RepID=UPI001C7E0017|nr:TetR/AcrR family transcriptional regulator [Tsukamurella sp. TY48]GIZ97892.1 TetR family transcriptional regulator [Tsukamurella sp. TY48]